MKLACLGAGGRYFARPLGDIAVCEDLHGSDIALYDIDHDRCEIMAEKARGFSAETGAGLNVTVRATMEEAVDGADFVLASIGGAGSSGSLGYYESPVHTSRCLISAKHGVYQLIGDTAGPAAMAAALRSVPVYLNICREIEKRAPSAVLLNHANPMAVLCRAMNKYTDVRCVIGICHGVQGGIRHAAEILEIEPAELDVVWIGTNHYYWCTRLCHKGKDVLPELWRRVADKEPDPKRRMSYDLARLHGYWLMYPEDSHAVEFYPYLSQQGLDDPLLSAMTSRGHGEKLLPYYKGEKTIDVAKRLLKSIKGAQAESIRLSLKQCIAIALENNLDLQIERITPLQEADDVTAERAAFDPLIVSGSDSSSSLLSVSESRSQTTTVGGDPSRSDSATAGIALEQPLHTGGALLGGYNISRGDGGSDNDGSTINPYWYSDVFIYISHPLLKGAGTDYNLAGIRVALNDQQSSEEDLRSEALSVVFEVEQAYWNLVRANEDLRVGLKSLQVAMDNRQSSRLQVEAGTRPELDLTTADAGVAERLSSVIEAEAAVRDREDELKDLVNLPQKWYLKDLRIATTDRPDEAAASGDHPTTLAEAIRTALKCRPEVTQMEIATRSAEIALRLRKNELLPSVSVSGVVGYTGLDESHGESTEHVGQLKYFRRGVALTFEYPIGNRSARAAHRRAKLDIRSAKLQTQQTRQSIIVSVRAALREIRTNRRRVLTTRQARDLHHERLQAEQRKKEVGLATSLNVLEVEEDFVAAERDYVNALVDHQISLANLEKETGTLLDVRGIQFEEILKAGPQVEAKPKASNTPKPK